MNERSHRRLRREPPSRAGATGDAMDAFLRSALRVRSCAAHAEVVRIEAHALADRWEDVARRIGRHRVGPLLYRALGDRDILPPALVETLRWDHRLTAVYNHLFLDALAVALRALADAGVAVIVLKGAALAVTVYRDVALRPMVDVDVLIRSADRETACRALQALGYVPVRAEPRPGALLAHESEVELRKPGPHPVSLDVHWSLFDSPHHQQRIAMDWFWDSAEPATIAGVPALVLGPEAQILHLCGHLMLHHAGHGLVWWVDVVEVIRAHAERIDWDELLTQARRSDLHVPVRHVLLELAQHWQAPVPGPVLTRLASERASRADTWVFGQLTRARRSAGRRFWTDLAGMSDWRTRWRFALANLFPSRAYMRERYGIGHPLLLPLYYPYRWLRGLFGS